MRDVDLFEGHLHVCKNCRWYEGDGLSGFCHANPPTIFSLIPKYHGFDDYGKPSNAGNTLYDALFCFPDCSADDWCSKWEANRTLVEAHRKTQATM